MYERGASFGYNNLVSDMRSLAVMRQTGKSKTAVWRWQERFAEEA